MNKQLTLSASFIAAAMLVLPAAHAGAMTKADYKGGQTRISEQYKADKAACTSLAANAKDICIEEAKAKEKVARAELQFGYSGKSSDRNKVLVAKAESGYAVAKERCDDLAGNAKDVCVKEAKAVEVKALADAKMGKEIGAARKEATEDKRDADYQVAAEKCEALAGDAKTGCIAAAKAKFGKN